MEINHLQVFFLAVTLHFISMLAIVGVTLYVSSIARSPFSALALSLGLFFLPKAFVQLFKRGIVYKLLNLFPINNYRTEDFLTFMSSKQEYILSSFVQNVVSTMIILLIIQLVLVCLVYWRMKQYQVA
ncbi:ABC transporter permease subunit [Clostridium sp. 1xD42-85]|uniref:ABC transporter permease subunit n=1 Tax=Clostridium sp. 1xD42-85 TaxID=2320084 RepID=UPI001314C1DA|nr:ABC transporter permease subunit [Clostridium sp. 1xD42-85]